MHKFNPINKEKLDNPWRREILPPKETLKRLGLKEEDSMADIGCGIGYFTIPAAEIINSNNKAYGLDILEEMLEEIKSRSDEKNINNIETIKTEEYDLKLEDETATFALMVNVLHEVKDKIRMLKEINRILKVKGKITIIEFEKKETKQGPPLDHRISFEEVSALLEGEGFKVAEKYEFGDTFYGVQGVKTK